jgi:2-dehydropantoate 2-reductase
MRVLFYGSGVIGQIYGGRLTQAGHDVTMLARGLEAQSLMANGIRLDRDGKATNVRPHIVTRVPDDASFDVAFVTVRRDQLAEVLPAIARLAADRIVFMLNQGADLADLRRQIGPSRTVFAFPGVGGRRTEDGTIRYLEISQQKTTIEQRSGIEAPVAELLRSGGFAIELRPNMSDWLKTHAVFITAVSAAILKSGGDSAKLAADRDQVAAMVAAVSEGFRALARQGVTVVPAALRVIFTVVPRFIAISYWQGQLRGPLGTLAIAPHVRAARDTEFPLMCDDVRGLVAGHGPTPHLDQLLQAVSAS